MTEFRDVEFDVALKKLEDATKIIIKRYGEASSAVNTITALFYRIIILPIERTKILNKYRMKKKHYKMYK